MLAKYIPVFLSLCLGLTLSCQILQDTDISFGNDLGQSSGHSSATDCCAPCTAVSGCVAFTWNSWNGGTCYFKGFASPQIIKKGVTTGIITNSATGFSCSAPLADHDIGQDDLKQVSGKAQGDCCGVCDATPGCRGFSWNDFQGGTCWLKAFDGPFVPKSGVSASLFYGEGPSPNTKWRVLKQFNMSSREAVASEWDIQVWQPGRVNNELEAYIDSPTTLFARDGGMVIKAVKQGNEYVSARIQSKQRFNAGNVASKKIRYEFTGTVPTAKGAWPAYWVLGDTSKYGNSPTSGELDIMEWVYQLHDDIKSSLHWKGGNNWGTDYRLSRSDVNRNYYTYGVEVSAVPNDEYVQFYVRQPDGKTRFGTLARKNIWNPSFPTCATFTPGASRCSPLAPFDNDMYLIANLAVGGAWGGCCGVDGDYSAFEGNGVEMKLKNVVVYEAVLS